MAETISVRAAAIAAGVSERTIRNWISSGKLPAERTAAGFRVRSEDLPGKVPASAGTFPVGFADVSALVGLVRELLPKVEAAAMWQARAELLAAQLSQAQDRIRALEAPQASPDGPQQASDEVRAPEATGASGRPWWRFW